MKRFLPWVLIALVMAGAYWGGMQYQARRGAPAGANVQTLTPDTACRPFPDGCTAAQGDIRVSLNFAQVPSPLTPFEVRVRAEGVRAQAISLRFSMQGMAMGENRYRLDPQYDGAWSARVILPVCAAGRRDWLAELDVKSAAITYRAEIPFQTH